VIKALVKALNATYPSYNLKSRNRLRVHNAYRDAMYFYKVSNHLNPDLVRQAYKRDRKDGFKVRRLGLIHPRTVPEGFDFLNLGHAGWCHPCSDAERSTASFLDLYEEALAECIVTLRTLYAVLSGQAQLDEVLVVGDASLDTGRENCIPVHGRPLPLQEILDDIYRQVEREVANEPPETSAAAEPTYR
jgi:hypothetical protein